MKTIKILTLGFVMAASVLTASAQYKDAQDSICTVNYFLFNQDFKNAAQSKSYQDAYEKWKIVLDICPKKSKNLYINGATMLKNMFVAEKDQNRRNEIINELMNMYDLRIANYGEAANVTARKANDLELLGRDARLNDYYALYAEAMRLGADQVDPVFIKSYFDATIKYVTSGNADTTLIIDNYDIATEALETIMSKMTDSAKKADVHNFILYIESRFSPFASCEELVKIYTKKFEANPDDITLLKKITGILSKKKCMDADLFFAATKKLYEMEPSSSAAYLMAQMCYKKDQFNDAAKYVSDALKDAEDKDKYKMYILQGLSYANINSYSAARSAYYKAAEADPSKGEPYRYIAQLYAKSSKSIPDGMGGRSAYWAAVDAANKAIAVDDSPENVDAANALIRSYRGGFPSQEDAFMNNNLNDGNSFTVPGWIGVSTTVRTRK